MAFCRFTLNTLLLFITRLIFSNSKSITLNPHLLNNDSGNREKFTIKVFPSKDEEETFNDPLKALIAQRFRRSAAASGKIDPKQYSFHDSHNIAEVHWSGKNSSAIMVLMKDPSSTMRSMHPSSFWVSRNYGINFTDISSNFTLPNGTHSTITEFFGSKADNKNYILVDKFNKYIFTSSDECRTFLRVKVYFHPTEIKYHPKYHNYVLAYEKDMGTKQLFSSTNNGRTWRYKSANVKSYYWGYSENYYKYSTYIYYLRSNWYGYSNIVKKSSPWGYYYSPSLAYNVEDFQLVNQYMFVTKNNSYPGTKDLYVSYMRGSFQNTSFPFKNYSTSFIIADASENETLVAANHNGTSNLYISNTEGTKYTLSLENILYYNEDDGKRSYFRHDFVDLHRIQGISGIYIATQLVGNKPGKRHLQSMITFDKGGYWSLMTAPSDHKNCSIWYHCSLHLSQEFGYHNPLLHFSPILSKPSAPGFVIGTGNVGETLKSSPNVYFSKDAGLSWKKLFSGHYYYNFLDHGGIIVAVQKYGLIEALQYSIDEGETWHGLKFTKGKSERVRVYGILTEPGEKTTVFTIYASYPKTHSWEVIQVDMKPVLGKKCSSSDYAEWIVTDQRNDTEKCVLGKKQKFERRKAKAICYNGRNYDRPIQVAPCLCVREDFKCDFGFKEQMVGWFDWECVHDSDFEDYSKKPPSWCKAGLTYNISSGYVKVPGDACYGGEEEKYEPMFKMCPIKKPDDFLLYAVRKSFYGYDFTLKDSIEFKIDGYANIVSLEYAYEKGILFFGDKDRDEIVMINTKNGNISKLLHFDSTSTHIESMAYDWIGDNLYYCDSGRAEIGVINVFGKHRPRKDLISSGDLDKPRALIVHPTKGYMFWTDWGIKPKIARATMDGNNIKEIITTTLHWPNGLTIDYDSNTLYFADAYQDRIEKCDLNGENRHVLRSLGIYHPYALTFYKGELYWDDSNLHSIFKVDKSGNNKQTVVSYLSYAMDIKAFSPERQKQGTNGCIGSDKKSKCSFICLPSEDNKHTCTCPQNLKFVKNGDAVSCKCPGTNEILSDGECKAVNKTKCLPTQFGCLNGECIPSHWKCDDEKDCSDGSDESTGLCSTCYSDQFKCNDGRCVLSSYKCDGEYDCVDKSDELYCPTATPTTPCSSGMVSCPDGSRCIMSSWFCDGEMDCDDNSDENIAYCKNKTIPTTVPTTYKPCLKTEFQCVSTGRCISEDWRCDDIEDCIDLSDELNCKNETCGTNQFKCSNDNLCVPNSVKCDHHNDCPDASDELNCDWTTGKPYVTKVLRCDDDHKYCADNTECYAKEGRCDGSYDCRDKSDEKDCPKRSTERPFCPKRQLCSSGRCINEYQVCDGRQDCPRGEDELNCKDEQCLPKPFGFNCTKNLKSECHLNNILCDGQFDCDDNSDEPPAICNVTKRVLNVNAKFVQPMDDGDLSVQISWTVPDVKISDAQSFIVKYIDDQHHVYSKEDLPLHPAYIKIPNIKPCRKYVFAVALRHTQLKLHQNLFTSTAEMESPGRRKPTAPVLRSSHDNQISWEQDKGDCMDHYEVQEAKLQCHEYGSSAFVDLSLEGNILFDASRKILGTGPNTNSRKFNCSIVVLYMNKKSGDIIRLQSEPFDFPDNSQTGKHTQGHKKRNTLVWAIPVALVVIALVVGLLLMGYKYRRLQNSFLAFAARGGYNRQVDDYDDDDDNMAVNFRTGEDAPMINRFSDDEPLVVG